MKFRLYICMFVFSLLGNAGFGQSEIIDKVFSNLPVEKRSQIEIIDTLDYAYHHWSTDNYYAYETRFGQSDFEFFLIYRHKDLNKVGLIVYGNDNYYATDAVADSIYFIRAKDLEYIEFYDEQGNYFGEYIAKSLYFAFEIDGKSTELWTLYDGETYAMSKTGNIRKDLFKAVSFTEVVDDASGNYVTGVFANLQTNEIVNSAVLNNELVRNEVYAYRYDSYYYGEYDYYYDYDSPDVDYTIPYFETRLNYEPIEIIYISEGDSISELINYSYITATDYYLKKNVPDDFSGVWSGNGVDGNTAYTIIDGDEVYSSYGVIYASVDAYPGVYEAGRFEFNEILTKMKISQKDKDFIESMWTGSRSDVRFLAFTSWSISARYKDFYLYNGETMIHVYLEYDMDKGAVTYVEPLNREEVFEQMGLAQYDAYMYTTQINDASGRAIPIQLAGVDYYYNYNISVADKNIDADGNLILTNESLGAVNFKAFSYGENYVGTVRVQWVGSSSLEDGGTVVSIKSMPFSILDQSKNVLCADVFSLYVSNVQGFNLYHVTNSKNQVGVLGPDGTWIVKQEWDGITILGPSSAYAYETIGLPAFFVVYKGTSCGVLDSKGKWIVPMGQEFVEICGNEILVTTGGKMSIYSFDGKLLISGIDGFGGGYYGLATDCYSFDYTASGHRMLVKNGKYGLVDENFSVVVPFEYTAMNMIPNTNQFIAVDADGKYGILETSSKIVLPFEYESIRPFDNNPNRLIASKDGKQGVIDHMGNTIIPFEFYSIEAYSDWFSNLIYISDPDYRTNIIDTTGKSIIDAPCSFVYLYPSYNIVYCADNGKADFYNLQGELIYSKILEYLDPYACYDYIQIYQVGSYENPSYGAFDINTGEEIMPAEFESLYPFWISDQVFFAGYKNGRVGIYSIDGVELVKPKGYYLDNYFYDDGYYGGEVGYYVEISNKKGKSKMIRLNW